MAQTSDRISAIAGRLAGFTKQDLLDAVAYGPPKTDELVKDVRSVAASALRQDERPGLWKRLFQRP